MSNNIKGLLFTVMVLLVCYIFSLVSIELFRWVMYATAGWQVGGWCWEYTQRRWPTS